MDWNELISAQRSCPSRPSEPTLWESYSITEFEKDYKMIISSSAFRRLQDKTQVFPLDRGDFVRTRLTHSIEVSTIGKQLGGMIYKGFKSVKKDNTFPLPKEKKQDIQDILLCAGLLHDLGNPPFGHFGETIIGDWFSRALNNSELNFHGEKLTDILTPQMQSDLKNFEGNAQAFRILSKCCSPSSSSDLKLTYSVMQTLMKYPVNSLNFCKDDKNIKNHKNGYNLAEERHLKTIADATGTIINNEIIRHPLTFILEAADDIAYTTADLEDAFKKELFTLDQFVKFYDTTIEELDDGDPYRLKYGKELIASLRDTVNTQADRSKESDLSVFNEWVKLARGWLMYVVAYRFTDSYSQIMSGKFLGDLFYDTNHTLSIQVLRRAMKKYVYNSSGILKSEISAQTILSFLLDRFVPAVINYDNGEPEDEPSEINSKYLDLISEEYKLDYRNGRKDGDVAYNLYLRLLMAVDYISGMTDSYAKTLYQELNGIS